MEKGTGRLNKKNIKNDLNKIKKSLIEIKNFLHLDNDPVKKFFLKIIKKIKTLFGIKDKKHLLNNNKKENKIWNFFNVTTALMAIGIMVLVFVLFRSSIKSNDLEINKNVSNVTQCFRVEEDDDLVLSSKIFFCSHLVISFFSKKIKIQEMDNFYSSLIVHSLVIFFILLFLFIPISFIFHFLINNFFTLPGPLKKFRFYKKILKDLVFVTTLTLLGLVSLFFFYSFQKGYNIFEGFIAIMISLSIYYRITFIDVLKIENDFNLLNFFFFLYIFCIISLTSLSLFVFISHYLYEITEQTSSIEIDFIAIIMSAFLFFLSFYRMFQKVLKLQVAPFLEDTLLSLEVKEKRLEHLKKNEPAKALLIKEKKNLIVKTK